MITCTCILTAKPLLTPYSNVIEDFIYIDETKIQQQQQQQQQHRCLLADIQRYYLLAVLIYSCV